MRSKILINILLFIGSVILFSACLNSASNKLSPPAPGHSHTMDESKSNGVFQFEVSPENAHWVLEKGLDIDLKESWVEKEWYTQSHVFGKATLKGVDSTYQLIMKFEINGSSDSNHFYFIGNKHLDTFIYHNCRNYYSNRLDTIKVPLYREITYDLPNRRTRQAFDSLTFVRRKEH